MEEILDKSSLSHQDKALLIKVLAKSPSDLQEDEVAIIRARRVYLTAVEREVFKEVLVEKPDYSALTVEKLKALCAEREIEIPEGVTKKADIIAVIEQAEQQ